jgi:succinoglycan biosynthesis transport protein ExoP
VSNASDVQDETAGGAGPWISKLPHIFWTRKWVIAVPAVLLAGAGAVVAYTMPTVYQANATMLVVSQEMPGEPSSSAPDTDIDRKVAQIRERILSRPDLVELIQAHNLYNASSRARPLSQLVDQLRDATHLRTVNADIVGGSRQRPGSSSIAFSLSVDYPRADLAQVIAQTFVDRLLKLDASQSLADTQKNVRLLEDQEAGLRVQVGAIESRINQITGQNGLALANAGVGAMSMGGGGYEGQIAALQRENAQLRAQTGTVAVERDPNVAAAAAQLAAARAQYADNHPDVRLAESRLSAARAAASGLQSRAVSGTVAQQIATNNAMIAQLSSARSAEQGRAATIAAAQSRGPLIAQQVAQLQGQADLIRQNLGKVSSNLLTARSAAKLAEERQGERLTLVEPPVKPDQPASPNRLMLILGGIAGGIAAGLGLALLLELLLRPIRSVSALARVTGAAPLAVVPVLKRTPFRPRRRRARKAD